MLTQLKGRLAALLGAAILAGPFLFALPALAQDGSSPDRPDETMGTQGGHMYTGPNEKGDSVMTIEAPKKKQEMPDIGPIYVMPQVNQGATGATTPPSVLPSPAPQAQPQQTQPLPQQRARGLQ